MGRNRPLHHQLKYAVMQSYRHRGQRRQFKQQWQELDKAYERGDITFEEWLKEKSKIWFVASRGDFWRGNRHKEGYLDSLIKFSNNFGRWIQNEFKVKRACDITPEMAQLFLECKAKDGVRATTLKKYVSMIKALNLACAKVYGLKYGFKFAKGIYVPQHALQQEARTIRIEPEDYERVINSEYFQKSKSKAKIGIVLARHFALRVNEIAKLKYGDIVLDERAIPDSLKRFIVGRSPYNAYLIIRNSKHGLHRVIPAHTEKEYELLKSIKKHQIANNIKDDVEIVGLDKDSVNTFFRRCLKNCGLNYYVEKGVNIHGLRKLRASEVFLEKLKEIYTNVYAGKNMPLKKKIYLSFKKAGAYVDKYLGHENKSKGKQHLKREGRWDLIKKYQLDVLKAEDIAIALSECRLDYKTALETVKEVLTDLN